MKIAIEVRPNANARDKESDPKERKKSSGSLKLKSSQVYFTKKPYHMLSLDSKDFATF